MSYITYNNKLVVNDLGKYVISGAGAPPTPVPPFNIGTGFNYAVNTLSQQSDLIAIGGNFTSYNEDTAAGRFAILEASTGAFYKDGMWGVHTFNNQVYGIYFADPNTDGNIYISGTFRACDGNSNGGLVKINGSTTVTALGPFNTGGYARKIVDDGTYLYLVGNFTTYNSQASARIVKMDKDGVIENNVFLVGPGFNNQTYSEKLDGAGGLYICGLFTTYNGVSANRIVKISTIDASVDTSFNYGVGFNTTVYALDIDGSGNIYAGGNFVSYADTSLNRIIKLLPDGTVDTEFNPGTGFNNSVYDIKIDSQNRIYCLGAFTSYNDVSINRIVRLLSDGTLDTSFDVGNGFKLMGSESEILLDSYNAGDIIVGGTFTSYNDVSVNRIMKLDNNGASLTLSS